MKIIGLTGRAGCGKNTMAQAIRDAHEPGAFIPTVEVIAFADALRDVAEAAFGSRYETQEEKAATDLFWETRLSEDRAAAAPHLLGDRRVTGRRILQFLGTEMFREMVHPNFWCMVMERRLERCSAPAVVITDVRFDNEAALIRRLGGVVLCLTRPNQPIDVDPHPSERPVSPEYITELISCRSLDHVATVAGILARTYL